MRLHNTSQLAGFAKPTTSPSSSGRRGFPYVHVPLLRDRGDLEAFKKEKGDWETFQRQFLDLLASRRIEDRLARPA